MEMYRHYLAMILTVDDMVGDLLAYLERSGKAENTLVIFTSDHGTQGGAHGITPWMKRLPYEESIHVPWIMRLPSVFEGSMQNDILMAPVDIFPTLCSLCGIPIPRTIEGYDLKNAWLGEDDAFEQEAVLTMGFSDQFDYIQSGAEWRGVRTKRYAYARWLSGETILYDLEVDPLQMKNLTDKPEFAKLKAQLESTLLALMDRRGDALVSAESYRSWFDYQRRVIRNNYGLLGNPEDEPDWSLIR